jgi:hypothetical protein
MPTSRKKVTKRWKGDPATTIRVLTRQNPKLEGSKAAYRYDLYKSGMTVAQYVKACEGVPRGQDALLDIAWDLDKRFIELDRPKT